MYGILFPNGTKNAKTMKKCIMKLVAQQFSLSVKHEYKHDVFTVL